MSKLLTFRGRASRLSYLTIAIGLYAAIYSAVFLIIVGAVAMHLDLPPQDIPSFIPRWDLPTGVATAMLATGIVALAPIIWMELALDVRRLHDFGVTGWLVLLSFVLVKAVPDPANWPGYLPGLGNLIWDAVMLLIPGSAGPNKYDANADNRIAKLF